MMTCREVLDSLSSFIDEDVKQEVMHEMRKHIHVCSDCRAQFDSMTMTIKLYRHEDNPQMPAECHDRLVKVLDLERMKPGTQPGAPTPETGTTKSEGPPKGPRET
jgi:predicted anti-sigma-YlaC factor YlaD